VVARSPDDLLAERVAGPASVAEEQLRFRRDDVGGVAHEEVEPLFAHGTEEVAHPELGVGHAVEPGVEAREGDGARVEVHPDHPARVPGGEERLDPAAAAEVEHGAYPPPDREPCEEERRRVEAHDVVAREVGGRVPGPVVSDHEALRDDEPHAGVDLSGDAGRDPERLGLLERERCERRPGLGLGNRDVQREELDERVERPRRGKPPHVERQVHPAGLGAERNAEGLGRLGAHVTVGLEGRPQASDSVTTLGIEHDKNVDCERREWLRLLVR